MPTARLTLGLVVFCTELNKVWVVLYNARTRRMHLKEEGREGKEKRGGRKLSFKKCNEVEEGRTNKVQSMRAPGHTSLTEGP